MFERFSDRARQVVVLAQEESALLKHDYIGTEHLLLGLLREEEGPAARVLEALGVTLERARAGVLRMVSAGEVVNSGQIPFTPRAKKVLELSLREAKALGSNYIGTEHILLGLVREGEGIGAQVLRDLGADAERIRQVTIGMLAGAGEPRSRDPLGAAEVRMLAGLIPVLRTLSHEISTELGRRPDVGDLLIVLASAQDTVAGRALATMGVDPDLVWGMVERVRSQDEGVRSALERQADEARKDKEQAIEAREFTRAAQARDQERALSMRLREQDRIEPETMQEIRRRLGLPEPPKAV